jgi:hypothetical protein
MATLRRLPLLLLAAVVAALVAGCEGGATRTPPSTSASAAPTTTAVQPTTASTASGAADLLAAYLRSWEVYADALRRLDPTRLPTAFAGNALRVARQEVVEHKAQGHPSLVRVDHHPRVLLVNATDGVVQDNYQNHSVLLNPKTGAPIEKDPNETVYQRQSLKRIGGVWKVVEVIEEKRP